MEKIKNDNNNNRIKFADIATFNYFDNAIITIAESNNIILDDIKSSQFKYILQVIGMKLFKDHKLLKLDHNIFLSDYNIYTNLNMYDFYKLKTIADIYILLSRKYKQPISVYTYSLLVNIQANNLYTMLNGNITINDSKINELYIDDYNCNKLNSVRIDLYKSLKNARNSDIIDTCLSSGAVGVIAVANNEIWNNNGMTDNNNNISSIEQLPDLNMIDTKKDSQ